MEKTYCNKCGNQLEYTPNAQFDPAATLMGCTHCDALWRFQKDLGFMGSTLRYVGSYAAHKYQLDSKRSLAVQFHTHPQMEEALRVPNDHVIVDKDVYLQIMRKLIANELG